MATTPLPPPPAPRASSERDARTQRRLDAARAARARRLHRAPTPPTLRQRLLALDERVAAYLYRHRNRTANDRSNQKALVAIGATVAILLSLTFAPILLLLPLLAWMISIGVRWGNAPTPPLSRQPRETPPAL